MSEPTRRTRYPELQPLKERLATIHARSPQGEDVEASLIHLVEALEETAYQMELHQYISECNDSTQNLANLARLEKHLSATAETLQAALTERNSYFRW
ncbi:MAG: hypothetical protein J0I12_31845 [Candidatus Eremiobacteraeota bacterium]|nr:hypothetical protein [Candidatus Eremiobacteraeota bacterium]